MIPVSLTVFVHNWVMREPPDTKEVLRNYYEQEFRTRGNILDFVLTTPIQEEILYRGPAFLLLMIFLWLSRRSEKYGNVFRKTGYALSFALLIALTANWASYHDYPITVFGYGMVWGSLILTTRQFGYSIVFHSACNIIALFLIALGYHLII